MITTVIRVTRVTKVTRVIRFTKVRSWRSAGVTVGATWVQLEDCEVSSLTWTLDSSQFKDLECGFCVDLKNTLSSCVYCTE